MTNPLTLAPGEVTLDELRAIWASQTPVDLHPDAQERIEASAASISRILDAGKTVYGINTGFGLLAQERIRTDQLTDLQRNLVLSHCCGVGVPLDDRVVRLMMALKVVSLARGFSGVRPCVVDRLLALIANHALPHVPSKGSVGASGDLAPLAHMTASAFLGLGSIRLHGESRPAAEVLAELNLEVLPLGPKEGLALLNGTQTSTALALDAFFRSEDTFASAIVAGAMSVDALKASDSPFDARLHQARGHAGQIDVAQMFRELGAGSEIRASHTQCEKIQDPYSVRCQPQVMGAILDVLRMVAKTLTVEANATTDNPLIFAESDEAVSGGNFHAEPVAFAADMLANATAEIASLSERRLAVLIDPNMSGLPAFLVRDGGLNSGFMIAQVTAAALVSENKTLAHPASVDSIPTSANQEDHVSMATFAARKAVDIARNAACVVGIELLAAAQGIDFHHPLKTSPDLAEAHRRIREKSPFFDADRYLAKDIAAAMEVVESGTLGDLVTGCLPSFA